VCSIDGNGAKDGTTIFGGESELWGISEVGGLAL
jgi:hypothetical protein